MGLPAAISLGLLVYISIVGIQSGPATQAVLLLLAVAVCSIAITSVFMYQRKVWLDSFVWYPTYGFMFQPGSLIPVTPALFDSIVKNAIVKWTPFFMQAESIVTSEVNWVWMKKDLNETTMNPAGQKVNGLTIAGTHNIEVNYNSIGDDLATSALAHEIGHIIYGNAMNNWSLADSHAFMAKNGLM